MQTRCIVKARLRKVHFSGDFQGGFCFSQECLFSRNPTRKPLHLLESAIFTNAPCKTTCLYNAPSMHTVEFFLGKINKMLPKPRFSKPIFGHSAGCQLNWTGPHCKHSLGHSPGHFGSDRPERPPMAGRRGGGSQHQR